MEDKKPYTEGLKIATMILLAFLFGYYFNGYRIYSGVFAAEASNLAVVKGIKP